MPRVINRILLYWLNDYDRLGNRQLFGFKVVLENWLCLIEPASG